MGSRHFTQVMFGKETTRGTAVAATNRWLAQTPAVGTDRKPIFPSEHVGINTPSVRSVIHQYLYQNTLSIEHGYFQALPSIFGCGLKGGVTATETNEKMSCQPQAGGSPVVPQLFCLPLAKSLRGLLVDYREHRARPCGRHLDGRRA